MDLRPLEQIRDKGCWLHPAFAAINAQLAISLIAEIASNTSLLGTDATHHLLRCQRLPLPKVTKYRGQQLPPDRQSFFYLCRSADDQYSVRPAPIAPLMAKPNCFLSTRFPTPPPLSSEHLILSLAQQGPYQLSPRLCTCTRTRRTVPLC